MTLAKNIKARCLPKEPEQVYLQYNCKYDHKRRTRSGTMKPVWQPYANPEQNAQYQKENRRPNQGCYRRTERIHGSDFSQVIGYECIDRVYRKQKGMETTRLIRLMNRSICPQSGFSQPT
jgi:hypothetical protein